MHSFKTPLTIAVIFMVAFGSCTANKTVENNPAVDSVTEEPSEAIMSAPETHEDSIIVEGTESYDCPRGQAEPVLKKAVYPQSIFRLDDDGRTGTETVVLDDNEQLIVKSWGCEYYMLTFRFETARFMADTTDLTYWLDKAATMMNEVANGIDVPLDIQGGTAAVSKLVKEKRNYLLGEEIVYREGSVRGFVTFDRIQKIDDTKFAIEISYASGPY